MIKGEGKPGAREVATSQWIEAKKVRDRRKLASLPEKLGGGEKEGIIMAEDLNASLLIDDPRARTEAKARKLKLISSPDILQEAKDRNLISNVRDALADLIAGGFRISDRLQRDILRRAGENP